MSAALEHEAEIWCPRCRETVGKVSRKQVREGVWEFVRKPTKMPPRCTRCETVLVRK